MAEELPVIISQVDQLAASIEQLIARAKNAKGSFDETTASQIKAAAAIKKYNDTAKLLAASEKANAKAASKYEAALKKHKTTMDQAIAEAKSYKKAQDELKAALNSETIAEQKAEKAKRDHRMEVAKNKKAMSDMVRSVKSVTGGMTGLVASLGVGTISLKSIYDAALKYNGALFELGRAESVAGRHVENLGNLIDEASKKAVMSRSEFAKFATTMSKSFIGAAPPTKEWGEFANVIRKRTGYSLEQFNSTTKTLIDLQNKLPSGFEKLSKAMIIASKVEMGGATKDEKEFLDMVQRGTYALAERVGMSNEQAKDLLAALMPLTQEQIKSRDVIKSNSELTAEFQRSLESLGSAALPVINDLVRGATEVFKALGSIPDTVAKIGQAFIGWKIASPVLGPLIKGMSKWTKASLEQAKVLPELGKGIQDVIPALKKLNIGQGGWIAGAAVAGYTAGKLIDKYLGLSDSVAKLYDTYTNKKIDAAQDKDVKKRLDDLRSQYASAGKDIDEVWAAITGGGKGDFAQTVQLERVLKGEISVKEIQEQREKQSKNIAEATGDEVRKATTLIQNYKKLETEVGARIKLNQQITERLQEQVKLAEEFGFVNKEAARDVLVQMQLQAVEADQLANAVIKRAEAETGKTFNIEGEGSLTRLESASKQLIEYRTQQAKAGKDVETTDNAILKINEAIALVQQRRQDVGKQIIANSMMEMQRMEQFSSAYERRLETQRKLMESAQFGLGASVEMMQKQVDLAHEFMKVYEQTDKVYARNLVDQTNITESQIQQVRSAKDAGEAQAIASHFTELTADEQRLLTKYASDHQTLLDKQMQQQQKIYDLTKEVREGYLDAIREMSVGVGEFSKIIGTHEMGVTQLMNVVKDVTGVAKLNTMALGGLQEQDLTRSGVGTKVGYRYTASGLAKNLSQEEEKANLGRIFNYNESVANAERGNVEGNVGTAVAASQRDKEALRDGTEEGFVRGWERVSKKWNQGFIGSTSRLPGKEVSDPGRPSRVMGLGMATAGAARGQVADVTGGPTLASEAFQLPNTAYGRKTKKFLDAIENNMVALELQAEEIKTQIKSTKKGTESYDDLTDRFKQLDKAYHAQERQMSIVTRGFSYSSKARTGEGTTYYGVRRPGQGVFSSKESGAAKTPIEMATERAKRHPDIKSYEDLRNSPLFQKWYKSPESMESEEKDFRDSIAKRKSLLEERAKLENQIHDRGSDIDLITKSLDESTKSNNFFAGDDPWSEGSNVFEINKHKQELERKKSEQATAQKRLAQIKNELLPEVESKIVGDIHRKAKSGEDIMFPDSESRRDFGYESTGGISTNMEDVIGLRKRRILESAQRELGTLRGMTGVDVTQAGEKGVKARIAANRKRAEINAMAISMRRGIGSAQKTRGGVGREITRQGVTGGIDFSTISPEELENLRAARSNASKMTLDQANKAQKGMYGGIAAQRFGRQSKEMEKQATASQQEQYISTMATQGAEVYGSGTGGNDEYSILQEMNKRLANIQTILQNGVGVHV